MLQDANAFSGFSVNDLAAAKKFYGETLGLDVADGAMGLNLNITKGNPIFVYEKQDHAPATYTMLNFSVPNIDETVKALKGNGVVFEHYDMGGGAKTDDNDVMRGLASGHGPDIAWFKDPAGNIVSILQEK